MEDVEWDELKTLLLGEKANASARESVVLRGYAALLPWTQSALLPVLLRGYAALQTYASSLGLVG